MIIEYDEEDRCILIDGEPISAGVAEGMVEDLEDALSRYYHDHDIPDGHIDE